MEPHEIAVYSIGAAVAAYSTFMIAAATIQTLGSKRINSQEELENIVKEKAENLGLSTNNLIAEFIDEDHPRKGCRTGACICGFDTEKEEYVSYALIDGKKVREIKIMEIADGFTATEGAVAHELYHLKNHFPKPKSRILKIIKNLYQEPAAAIYGIKER